MTNFLVVMAVVFWSVGCFFVGISLGMNDGEEQLDEFIGAHVENHVCSDEGCSFLVRYPNQETKWLYQHKLVTE